MDNYALSYHLHGVRWAFIRLMRRVIMFLSTLVRWALVCSRLRNKVPLCGGVPRYRAPRKCNFSWVVVPGWFITRSLGEGVVYHEFKLICVSKYRIENMCRLRDKSIHLDSGVKPRNDKLIEQVTNPAVSYHPVPTTRATGGGVHHPKPRRRVTRVTSNESRVTRPAGYG